jgi:hypothetical protein
MTLLLIKRSRLVDHSKTGLVRNSDPHCNLGCTVTIRYSNGHFWTLFVSGFRMALADILIKPFENRTKKSGFQMALDHFIYKYKYSYIQNGPSHSKTGTIRQPDKNRIRKQTTVRYLDADCM